MFKILFALLFGLNVVASALEFSGVESEYIHQNPIVTIALMPDFSPFSYIDNDQIVGFENDLLQLIAQKSGLEFKKEFGVWNKNLSSFKEKKVDVIASISYKKERESFVDFTTPYYKIPIMIFVRDDFGAYDGIESLYGKRVGILKDVFYSKELQELGKMELVVYETYEEVTEALVFGKIDALIQNLPNINYLIKKNLYSNLVLAGELQLPGILKEDLRFGVNPEKPILHSIFQKTLDSIPKEQMQALVDRWIDVKYNTSQDIFSFTKVEQKYLDEHTVKYCIDPRFQPFEFINKKGNHAGLTRDYLDKIIKKTGMKTELVKTKDWSQTLDFLESKKCEMILAIAQTNKRDKFLLFTKAYLDFPLVVAMRSDAEFVSKMGDIVDKKLGITKDYALGDVLMEEYGDLKPRYMSGVKEGLQKVASGEIDGFIDFLPVISSGINNVATGNLKIAGKIDEKIPLRMAVGNDDAILYGIMEKSLSAITPEEHKQILDKWMTIRYEYGVDYSMVWRIVGATIFLLLLFGYWNHKIQQAKKIIEKQNKELETLAMTDKLTGVYNRSKLDEIVQVEIERAKRYGQKFGCAIVDIDYFKDVNDTYGHLAGDKVLIEIATLIRNSIRKSDYFGRWGGEEFLIIAPLVDKDSFPLLLKKIKEIIANHSIQNIGNKTISIGATIYIDGDTEDSIIKRADTALYEAKNSGRNQVRID